MSACKYGNSPRLAPSGQTLKLSRKRSIGDRSTLCVVWRFQSSYWTRGSTERDAQIVFYLSSGVLLGKRLLARPRWLYMFFSYARMQTDGVCACVSWFPFAVSGRRKRKDGANSKQTHLWSTNDLGMFFFQVDSVLVTVCGRASLSRDCRVD